MDSAVKRQLPVIIVVTLVGVITAVIFMTLVHDSAASLEASQFGWLAFLIPCAIMLIGSFAITFTASEISRQLYVVTLAICLLGGIAAMLVINAWQSDPETTSALLANSAEGATIIPTLKAPITILRDIAAFIVIPTVGCILGAWIGSKFHALSGKKSKQKSKK